MNKCIVIGNDHYNTLNVIRALGKACIPTHLILVADSPSCFTAKSKYIASIHIADSDEKAIQSLLTEFKSHAPIPVIPTCDSIARSLDRNLNSLKPYFILPSVAIRQGALENLMRKENQLPLAQNAGFNVPASATLSPRSFSLPPNISFPCIIKPTTSADGSKHDFLICQSSAQWNEFTKKFPHILSSSLIQDFIPNKRLKEVMGIRLSNGHTFIGASVDKLKFGNKIDTMGLNVVSTLYPDPYLEALCKKFIESADFYGIFAIEVIETIDSNDIPQYYFIEANLRTDACLFLYNKANINYPAMWALQHTPSASYPLPNVVGMNEIHYIKHFTGIKRIAANFKDFLRTNTFAYFSFKDPKPFFAKILGKF